MSAAVRRAWRRLASGSALAAAAALASCAGEEGERRPALPPLTTAEANAAAAAGQLRNLGNSRAKSGDSARIDAAGSAASADVADGGAADDAAPARARRVLPEPTFGSESPKPGDPHRFRLSAALRAMRASRSGKAALTMLSLLPDAIEAKQQTGVDPFADGEWLLVYGARPGVPGANACVVKHAQPESEAARADGGALGGVVARAGVREPSELFGVKAVLVRPQPGVLALVPTDRAQDLASALSKSIDPGVRPGELVRAYVAGPVVLRSLVSQELSNVTLVVKPASDGGLDVSGESDCPDAAACAATASDLADAVRSKNGMMVRLVVGGMLGTFTAKAEGTKLRASLHAEPHAVDALVNLARAELSP